MTKEKKIETKDMKLESDYKIYLSRISDLLERFFEFLQLFVGCVLYFIFLVIAVAFLYLIIFPITIPLSIIEFILVPVPYYILTGKRYYDFNDSLTVRCIDFIDEFGLL